MRVILALGNFWAALKVEAQQLGAARRGSRAHHLLQAHTLARARQL